MFTYLVHLHSFQIRKIHFHSMTHDVLQCENLGYTKYSGRSFIFLNDKNEPRMSTILCNAYVYSSLNVTILGIKSCIRLNVFQHDAHFFQNNVELFFA